jgi:hypothetical protein
MRLPYDSRLVQFTNTWYNIINSIAGFTGFVAAARPSSRFDGISFLPALRGWPVRRL